LNGVDDIIIFHNLTEEHMLSIVDLQMKEVGARLRAQGVELTLSAEARQWLADKGYDPQFGARPLRRAMQRYIENPLSIQLLSGQVGKGKAMADVEDDAIIFVPLEDESEQEAPEPVPAEQAVSETPA
jgi:ATP-dependent Clp protease ATP-binding subunit ClpA